MRQACHIPLSPSLKYSVHLTKILILKKEGIVKKFPMSAAPMSRYILDIRSLFWVTSYWSMESSTPGLKGL